jgi:hypothetical protein
MHKYGFLAYKTLTYIFLGTTNTRYMLFKTRNVEGNARQIPRPQSQQQLKLTPVRPLLRLRTPMTHRVPLDNFRETESYVLHQY